MCLTCIQVAFKKDGCVSLGVRAIKNGDSKYKIFGNCLQYAAAPFNINAADIFMCINEVITYFKKSGGVVILTLTYNYPSITSSGFTLPAELALPLVDRVDCFIIKDKE